jgi:hypothetical protein
MRRFDFLLELQDTLRHRSYYRIVSPFDIGKNSSESLVVIMYFRRPFELAIWIRVVSDETRQEIESRFLQERERS